MHSIMKITYRGCKKVKSDIKRQEGGGKEEERIKGKKERETLSKGEQ